MCPTKESNNQNMAESVLCIYNNVIFKERKGTKGLILLKAPIPEHIFLHKFAM